MQDINDEIESLDVLIKCYRHRIEELEVKENDINKHLTDIMGLMQHLSAIIDNQQLQINQLKELLMKVCDITLSNTRQTILNESAISSILDSITTGGNKSENKI